MGATLIINPGSSSKKFALFANGSLLMTWHFEQTGQGFTICTEQNKTKSLCRDITAADFRKALEIVLQEAETEKLITATADITRVGVRVVAPATYFAEHRVIDEDFVSKLRELTPMAPHHIPSVVAEIEHMNEVLPEAELIGVSDSAFHRSIDNLGRLLTIPRADAERFDMERFGYHGISVASIVNHLIAKEGGVPYRLIVCHIGSGVSVTAVQDGKSVATSMGYTPVSGIMMSSRMGDVPADVLAALIIRKGLKPEEIFTYMYGEGGFRGLTGVKDLRLVLDRASKLDPDAQAALALFAREVKGEIAKLAMQLNGVEMIVLTGTAAERNPTVRSLLVGQLQLLRTYVHEDRNEALMNREGYIQTDDSEVKILVLKTDELGEMFRIVSRF